MMLLLDVINYIYLYIGCLRKFTQKKFPQKKAPKPPNFRYFWGFGGLGAFFWGRVLGTSPKFWGPPNIPQTHTKGKNMASMRSSLLSLLLEHSFEEEETATMLIMLPHPGEATTQICFFLLLLIKYNNSLRFRSQLKRPALLSPRLSPWSRQTESVLKTSEY